MGSAYEYKVLGRFDSNDPEDPHGDAATLAALAAEGSDLSKPTHFIHYLNFPDEANAKAAGKALAEQFGYRVRGFGPDATVSYWDVRAETKRVPSIENMHGMRRDMMTAAERYCGEYDGWEAAVQP